MTNTLLSGLTDLDQEEESTLESWAVVMLAAATELRDTEVFYPSWDMEERILNQCLGRAYVSPGWFLDLEGTPLFPKVRLDIKFSLFWFFKKFL